MGSTVGGLVGDNMGTIAASYATGDVDAASGSATINGDARAGGLVGNSIGGITASYATGDATATAAGTDGLATAGGLVGNAGGTITASYSTGMPAATGANTGSNNAGGLVGTGSADVINSYFDMMSSKTATTTTDTDSGKTTLELQAPTPTSTDSIYAMWDDVDIDGTADDPWDFGGNWQYPVLQYGKLDPADQRAKVTLMLSPATISEKGGKTTVTATQDRKANLATVLTVSVDSEGSAVTLSDNTTLTTLTIPAGSKESTGDGVTITAVDNNDVADQPDQHRSRVGDSGPRAAAAQTTSEDRRRR